MVRTVLVSLLLNSTVFAIDPVSKPNIVFILADDLGYGDLSCYGQKKFLTPNIDRLAKDGKRFTQFYAGSTVCAPSRCTLMTGYHTGHALIRGNGRQNLGPSDRTVTEVLKLAGYRTGLFGKWGLGEENTSGIPTKKGFDAFFGYLNQNHAHNYYPDFLYKGDSRFPIPENVQSNAKGVAKDAIVYSPDAIAKEANAWLATTVAEKKPFFLFFASTLPHANTKRLKRRGTATKFRRGSLPMPKNPGHNPKRIGRR